MTKEQEEALLDDRQPAQGFADNQRFQIERGHVVRRTLNELSVRQMARVVAKHYLSLATAAEALCRLSEYPHPSSETDRLCRTILNDLAAAVEKDFGAAAPWIIAENECLTSP